MKLLIMGLHQATLAWVHSVVLQNYTSQKQQNDSDRSRNLPMTPNLSQQLINCFSLLGHWCGNHQEILVGQQKKCVHQCLLHQCVLAAQPDLVSPSLSSKVGKSPRTIASWKNCVPNWVFASQNWKIRISMIQELT